VKLDVTFDELIPHPIEAVWSELTHAAAISEWLMVTGDFEPAVGCRFRLKTEDLSTSGYIEAEVIDLDPPHRMVWTWSAGDGNAPSTVTFELSRAGDKTRLRLRHVGEFDSRVAKLLREGWPGRISAISQAIKEAYG
jgi:uncharacterized protein YndB with AHSA1/START domain